MGGNFYIRCGKLADNLCSRLKAELKKLRKMYEEQIKISREEFMMVHSKKVGAECIHLKTWTYFQINEETAEAT